MDGDKKFILKNYFALKIYLKIYFVLKIKLK
jgi:hypothetical protein